MFRTVRILLTVAAILISDATYAQNLIRNPSFETVPCITPCNQDQGIMPSDWFSTPFSTILPGADTWSNNGSYGLAPGAPGHFPGVVAADGIRWVAGASNAFGLIEFVGQTLTAPLTAGARYTLTAYVHRDNGSTGFAAPTPGSWRIELWSTTATETADKIVLGAFGIVSGNNWEFQTLDFAAPAGASTHGNLVFVAISSSTTVAAYPALDNVSLTVRSLVRSGSFAQVASGGGWKTTFTLINLSATRVTGLINFYSDDGNPLNLSLLFPQSVSIATGSSANFSIDPNASFVVESEAAGSAVMVGWADVQASGALQGYIIFRQRVAGVPDSEGTVPVDSQASSTFVLPYDNTSAFQTGIALANQSTATIPVNVILRDDNGNQLGNSQIVLGVFGHMSFFTNGMFAQTANRRGTIEFRSASGNITGVGLRFSPTLSFTSVPIIR